MGVVLEFFGCAGGGEDEEISGMEGEDGLEGLRGVPMFRGVVRRYSPDS